MKIYRSLLEADVEKVCQIHAKSLLEQGFGKRAADDLTAQLRAQLMKQVTK